MSRRVHMDKLRENPGYQLCNGHRPWMLDGRYLTDDPAKVTCKNCLQALAWTVERTMLGRRCPQCGSMNVGTLVSGGKRVLTADTNAPVWECLDCFSNWGEAVQL